MNRKQQITELKIKGFSYGKIGKIFNVSRQRIHQIYSGYQSKGMRKINGKMYSRRNTNINIIFDQVFKRDNWICQKCGKKGILIHHIDKNWQNNNFNNLICLCNNCHLDLHRPIIKGRKNWNWKGGITKDWNKYCRNYYHNYKN